MVPVQVFYAITGNVDVAFVLWLLSNILGFALVSSAITHFIER